MMHRPAALLIGAACALVFTQMASAADLSRWVPGYTPARPPAFDWSGCYVGVTGGAMRSR